MEVQSQGMSASNEFVTLLNLKDYFIAITLQFIDNEWRLWNIPLAFTEVVGPHTKEAIGSLIAQVLSFYLGVNLNSTSVDFSFYFMSVEPNFPGENVRPFAGVIDGGDIACVKETAKILGCEIKDRTCICHMLNNIIRRMLDDYFEDNYLAKWRPFVRRLRQSKPFEELWNECCRVSLGKEVILQPDTPTRWSSAVNMLSKAVEVKLAVERMVIASNEKKNHEVNFRICFFIILHFYSFVLILKDFVPNWDLPTWSLLEKYVELFQPTAEAIKCLEGQKYVTQSLILLQLCALEKSNNRIAAKCMFLNVNIKLKLIFSDPQQTNPQLHVVIVELEKEINSLWDNLPVDTVIATLLDPRTKFFPRIPEHEVTEALKVLKKVKLKTCHFLINFFFFIFFFFFKNYFII
jgi:hypothetical protein